MTINVEVLDDRRIKFCALIDAPPSIVYSIWNQPEVSGFLQGENKSLKEMGNKHIQRQLKSNSINRLSEISMASDLNNTKLYAHFLQRNSKTIATITVDLKKPGASQKILNGVTEKALSLLSEVSCKLDQLDNFN